MNTLKVDGYSSFSGGMDSSRGPSIIDKNQYIYSVNCFIPKSNDGIATRKGFREVNIRFQNKDQEEIFSTGNFQASGNYINSKGDSVLIYVIGGYFFELKGNKFQKDATILNYFDQNDPNQYHNYIIQVPSGLIINDGYSAPFYTSSYETRRTKPRKREIGAGLMGVYVQNRLWFVRPNGIEIWASTIKQPLSMDEAIIDNIYGITCPEENERITAIGKQGTARRDAVSGNLCFTTHSDFYSADVRGARTSWGIVGGQGTGFVNNTIPGVGASSHTSFESFNSNIFFRNPRFGLVSLNQTLSEFTSRDTVSDQMIEASLFFDNDTKRFLNSCHTKKYKKSLFTTIAPEHRNGFVFWNGLIVKTPDPYYGKNAQDNKYTDIVESVWTGIRPWDIQVVNELDEKMFILSLDHDNVNRLYFYDETLNYDVCGSGISEIESKILTRSQDFSQPFLLKKLDSQIYSLSNINQDTRIVWYNRFNDGEDFRIVSDLSFKINNKEGIDCERKQETRESVSIGSIKNSFYSVQDLIVINGSASIQRSVKTASIEPLSKSLYRESPVINKKESQYCYPESVFTYKLCQK